MRKLFLLLCIVVAAGVCAQEYNVVMPGQKKVTTVDSTGTVTTKVVSDYESDLIQYRSGTWYYQGKTMSEEEFVAKMKAECQPAYEKFQSSVRKRKTGVVLASVGGATMAVGAGLMIWGGATADYIYYTEGGYNYKRLDWNWQMISGLCMLIGGGGLLIGGVATILVVAPDCKRKAHHIYNRECASKEPPLTMNFGVTENGIGMALNF